MIGLYVLINYLVEMKKIATFKEILVADAVLFISYYLLAPYFIFSDTERFILVGCMSMFYSFYFDENYQASIIPYTFILDLFLYGCICLILGYSFYWILIFITAFYLFARKIRIVFTRPMYPILFVVLAFVYSLLTLII